MGLPLTWGSTAAEEACRYPADDQLSRRTIRMTRAISVAAPVQVTWRWLCQLAVAPYSYDWIDNRGRRSPRELTAGSEVLEVGQIMETVFHLVAFDDGHHWTGVTTPRAERLFGTIAVTYAAEPDLDSNRAGSRIVCRMVAGAEGRLGRPRVHALAWGDLVMMRKQLLTLKELAERSG